jgi:hypothetical protein
MMDLGVFNLRVVTMDSTAFKLLGNDVEKHVLISFKYSLIFFKTY